MTTGDDSPAGHRRWLRVVVAALVGVAAGLATGWIALGMTRPGDDELQRAALDEIGLPADLEDAPVIGPELDAYTNQVEERILAEYRFSIGLALTVGVIIAVATTVAAHAGAARTSPANPDQLDDDTEVAHGRRH